MAWFYLIIAGLFEVVWAIGIKFAENFTKVIPSIITLIAMVLSVYFLNKAMNLLPVGTAYAIWTGIGAIGTVLMGMVLFGESREWGRIFFLMLILIGIIGLKINSGQ